MVTSFSAAECQPHFSEQIPCNRQVPGWGKACGKEMPSSSMGGPIRSALADWAVAQRRFANGAQAQVTASRVAVGLERKLRALGPEGEMRVDFLARSLEFLAPDGGQSV